MNEQEYIELIDKEMAGTISPDEREALYQYMRKTPGAQKLYREVLQTSNLLRQVSDVEPPGHLKQSIMNSLDFNRHRARGGRPVMRFLLKARQVGLKPRLAYAFALGMVVGLVVYSVFLTAPGGRYGSDVREMYGTIGISEESRFAPVERVPVDMPEATGSVNLLRFEDLLRFKVILESTDAFEVLLLYDPAQMGFSGLRPLAYGEIGLETDDGCVSVSGSGAVEFMLAFVTQTASAIPVDFKIMVSGETILSHRFDVGPEPETRTGEEKPGENGRK
ncbi:MAG: hypothetical protein ABIJ00_04205 [Candidatus Eisenbacteria bacterium]